MAVIDGGPDFICVGPHKTGTGWLYSTLNQHKEIFPVTEKEIRYYTKLDYSKKKAGVYLGRIKRAVQWLTVGRLRQFAKYVFRKEFWKNRKTWWRFLKYEIRLILLPYTLASYKKLVSGPEHLISGDISPSYATMDLSTIRKIKEDFPNVKIILLIREPLSRVWSHVKMKLDMKRLPHTEQNIDWVLANYAFTDEYKLYPGTVMKNWTETFEDEHLFVGYYNELIQDPCSFYQRICGFLGISQDINKSVETVIHPYRIGHLVEPQPTFKDAKSLLTHRWKSGGVKLEMPQKLKKKMLKDILPELELFHSIRGNEYTAAWIEEYKDIMSH